METSGNKQKQKQQTGLYLNMFNTLTVCNSVMFYHGLASVCFQNFCPIAVTFAGM